MGYQVTKLPNVTNGPLTLPRLSGIVSAQGRLELSTESEVSRLLAQGVAFAQAGQRVQAYNVLLDVVELDQHNELAWLWLSTLTDNLDDQRICLENVLTINPNNTFARERFAALSTNGTQPDNSTSSTVICPQCGAGNRDFVRQCSACGYAFFVRCPACGEFNLSDARTCDQCGASLTPSSRPADQPAQWSDSAPANISSVSRPPAPISLWPVVAFWASISLFFIGGGVASLLQFVDILLHARGVIQNLGPIQIAWLPMGLFFIAFGLTGVSLAWQLAHRRSSGYYGSLLFGMVLMFLGPSASLVLEPPNYLATVCTGLMPAAAVLLTLASMTGFETYAIIQDRSLA